MPTTYQPPQAVTIVQHQSLVRLPDAVAVGSDGMIHPVWADTRNPIYVFDPSSGDARTLFSGGHGADIYTATIADSGP